MKTQGTEMAKLQLSEEVNTVFAAVVLGFMLWATAVIYMGHDMNRFMPLLVFYVSCGVITPLFAQRVYITVRMYKLETQKVQQ